MFCGKCGNKIEDGARFCEYCGFRMENTDNAPVNTTVAENTAEPTNSNGADFSQAETAYTYHQNAGVPQYSDNYNYPAGRDEAVGEQGASTLSKTLSIVLCVFFFLFTLSAMGMGIARSVLSEDGVKKICNDIDLSKIQIRQNGVNIAVPDLVLSIVDEKAINKYGITRQDVVNVLNNATIKKYLENFVNEYVQYVAFGKAPKLMYTSEIIGLIKDSADIIYNMTGYVFTDSDFRSLENEINNGSMEFLTAIGIERLIGFSPSIISAVFSIPVLIILIVLSVSMLALLLICNNMRVKYLFAYCGITLSVLGAMLLLAALALLILPIVFGFYLLEVLRNALIFKFLIPGSAAFAIGMIMFLLYLKVFKRKSRTAQAV